MCRCTFRGRVKTVEAADTKVEFTFDYSDTIKIQDKEYGVAWRETKDIQLDLLKKEDTFWTWADKSLVNILLNTDRREVTVTFVRQCKKITKVEFSYD